MYVALIPLVTWITAAIADPVPLGKEIAIMMVNVRAV
jgi:hypothetical protein